MKVKCILKDCRKMKRCKYKYDDMGYCASYNPKRKKNEKKTSRKI